MNSELRTRIQFYWQQYPLLRWALVHWLTWPLGLFLAAFLLQIAQFIGLLLAGAVVGAVVGAGQAYLLYAKHEDWRRWILVSAVGGLIGSYPAYIFAFMALFSWWIAALLIGLAIGGGIGAMQAWALYRSGQDYLAWLSMTVVAAAFGAWLAFAGSFLGWPMLLSPSGAFFGLALGYLHERRKVAA